VLEETGIAVDAALRLQTEYTYPHGRLRLYFFDCVPTGRGGELAPRAPFRWVSVADLPSLAFPPANGAVLESLRHCPEPVVPCQ
jgi:8-oxo-dGTP diphosphatase